MMEQLNTGLAFPGKAVLKIPVQALQPMQMQSVSNNPSGLKDVELPSKFSSARILKLPPGYVILKDAQGSFKGLARVPMKIPAPVPIAEPPKKQPAVENSSRINHQTQPEPSPIADADTEKISTSVQSQGDPKVVTSVTGKRQILMQLPERTATSHGSSLQVATPVAKKSPIPIQPKGPAPKVPWSRDYSRDPPQPWKKEPLVLYSGAPLKKDKNKNKDDSDENTEDEFKSRKEKEPPPQSLPCPEKLDAILPKSSFKYHISSFEELSSPDRFKTEVRANITSKEAALKWIREFEEASGTNFRVAKSFKENSKRLVFKKCFRCHKNTNRKETAVRESQRHVGCLARVAITIKNPLMKQSNDPLLKEFPCVLSIHQNHCHSLTTLDSLRYRRPLPEVREKFSTMFKA